MMRKPRRVEDSIQSKTLAELTPMLLDSVRVYAIPNGGFRLFHEARRLKDTGVRAGICDLVFLAPVGATYWLEMKTMSKGSRLSDEQEGFKNYCLRSGHNWGMARSVAEAIQQVCAWGLVKPWYRHDG